MKRVCLALAGAMLSTCGPPVPQECCTPVSVARGTVYSGTIAGSGTTLKVELAGANATLTFVRDGHQVTEAFTAVSVAP